MFYLWFTTVLLLASNIVCEVELNKTASQDDVYLNYTGEQNCSSETITWHISVDKKGIGLIVFLNSTQLNPDNEEYISISADKSMDGKNASVTYITGDQKNIALGIPMVHEAFLTFSPGTTCNNSTNFNILIKQYEESPPELAVTTPNPNPPSGIKTNILIYLAGKTLSEFQEYNFQIRFKEAVKIRAFNFCDTNDITYDSSKSGDTTIFLTSVQTCSNKWPDYETCVSALMSVFVSESRVDYELTTTHLEQMWDEIQETGLPADVGVQPYDFPSVSEEIGWWVLWIVIAVAATFLVAIVLWKVEKGAIEFAYQRQLEEEKKRFQTAQGGVDLRPKKYQLPLAKHQKIPEFMLGGNADAMSVVSTPPPSTERRLNSPPTTFKFNFTKPSISRQFLENDSEDIPLEEMDKRD